VFGIGETLATTLTGLATRIAAKIAAYTYAFLVNRLLGPTYPACITVARANCPPASLDTTYEERGRSIAAPAQSFLFYFIGSSSLSNPLFL
jgi:hypothetical protein